MLTYKFDEAAAPHLNSTSFSSFVPVLGKALENQIRGRGRRTGTRTNSSSWVLQPVLKTGRYLILYATLILATSHAVAQTVTDAVVTATTNSAPIVPKENDEKAWSFSASASIYLVPNSREYVQPTFTADHNRLHLEARYNYEDLETGSAWVGYNFSVGNKLALELTPMVGGVFGNTTGVAPGYKFTLSYWKLELYSESEYVFDVGDSSGDFFYAWTELTLAPTEWFRFGVAAQRTRAYHTERDIEPGFVLGFSYKKLDFATYVFNPDRSRPTLVFAVAFNF